MKVIQPSRSVRGEHQTDHDFVHKVIQELDRIPTKDKVYFPLPNRSSTFADIECTLDYNSDCRATGEFAFVLRKHELEMAHTAVITTVVEDAKIKIQLQIKPNTKLRKAGHRSILKTCDTPKDVAVAICRNYFPGSVGRKVVVAKQKETA